MSLSGTYYQLQVIVFVRNHLKLKREKERKEKMGE
jgi:hypothetical protein